MLAFNGSSFKDIGSKGGVCTCVHIHIYENLVCKFRLNGKRETSPNKNTSENQHMHLNAGARVPLSWRVCLGHIPSPNRCKIQICR